MTIGIEFWQLLAGLAVIGDAFTGLGKLLLMSERRHIDEQIAALQADSQQWRSLERDFLKLKAELPVQYVRREDYIRNQTVIEAKLDAIASELKVVQIQGAKRGG